MVGFHIRVHRLVFSGPWMDAVSVLQVSIEDIR